MQELATYESPDIVATVEPTPGPCPALVYLARLAPLGAVVMRSALECIVEWLRWPRETTFTTFPWHLVRYEHAIVVRQHLLRDYAPSTGNRYLAALRGAAKQAYVLGQMSRDDYERLALVPTINGSRLERGRALAPGELAAMLDVSSCRDAAMLTLLYGCGLRRGELVALDLEHVEDDGVNTSLRVIGKGNKERRIYLPAGAIAHLRDWLQLRGTEPGPLVFRARRDKIIPRRMHTNGVYNRLQLLAKRAGISAKISPHDLRRTYITELLDKGADVFTVQKLAGHAQATTTARYDKRPDAAKVRAVALLHVPYKAA